MWRSGVGVGIAKTAEDSKVRVVWVREKKGEEWCSVGIGFGGSYV
jgi:hypothetical protein